MKIDEKTLVMLRLHRQTNTRGLQIYNPYFQEVGLNAVYILAHNPDPKPLLEGLRDLNFAGAICAGFETDTSFAKLLDELSTTSQAIGKVGIVINDNGKLRGHYQGGQGLYQSIVSKYGKLSGKKIVMLGAGGVAEGLLLEMQNQQDMPEITIVNRTLAKAENLATKYNLNQALPFSELESTSGDVFINMTGIGSPWNNGEDYVFKPEFIQKFNFIGDVTFVPIEPQLIKVAKEVGVDYAPGHRMFLYQAGVCLKEILGHEIVLPTYEKLMLKDFETNWS
jgi:shikimate dehydrogenase